ncbi:MAG: tRNA epoxyqueuosine(34) reductase QueG [candidate division NC10 bacterium]|nr:tRNA epoxyqueuosine(34) reductase QueG [candidate division NC10 bacterium]
MRPRPKEPVTEPERLARLVKDLGRQQGFDLVGISPASPPPHEASFAEWLKEGYAGEMAYLPRTEAKRRHPGSFLPWAKSVISVALNYYSPFQRPTSNEGLRGWIARYAWGDDYHGIMEERLAALHRALEEALAHPVRARPYVDAGPVLERDFAARAGIGWFGKNTNLLSTEIGSYFFLGELFTDLDLAPDTPIRDRCGQCTLCLQACPTNAFVGPYVLDARRCISYLTIELKGAIPRDLRPLVGIHVFGCDICQEVCPYNTKPPVSTEAAFFPREGLHAPDLLPLLALTEEEFRTRFRNSPITRAKRRGFFRNVCVALGNLRDPSAIPGLTAALADPEPLVRGHAAWALGQIGGAAAAAALEAAASREPDPAVREEIQAALAALPAQSVSTPRPG